MLHTYYSCCIPSLTIPPRTPSRASVANRSWAHHGTAFGAWYLPICLSVCLSCCILVCPSDCTETRYAHTNTHSHARARTHTLLHVLPEARARAHTRTKHLSPSRAFVCILYVYVYVFIFVCIWHTTIDQHRAWTSRTEVPARRNWGVLAQRLHSAVPEVGQAVLPTECAKRDSGRQRVAHPRGRAGDVYCALRCRR